MIARSTKESLARFLLLKEGMEFKKGVACLMVAILLGMTGTALAAPQFVALMFNKAQNAVAMRLEAVPGATNYKILRSETEGSGHTEIGATPRPMFLDSNVEPGTTYYYIFVAVTPGGEVKSDEKSVTIPGQKKKALPPPEITRVEPTARLYMGKQVVSVGVAFNHPRAGETMGFSLYRSETAGGPYNMISSPAPTDTSYTDEAVEIGKTYYYVMTALSMDMMETDYSTEVSAKVEAAKIEKKKRVKKLRAPIPRKTEVLWRTWNIHPDTEQFENRAEFDQPTDIEYDPEKGLLYIPSAQKKHIVVLQAADGKFVKYLGPKIGDYTLLDPLGIGIDKDGNLYVIDIKTSTLVVFTPDGDLIRAVPIDKKDFDMFRAIDVAVADDGRAFVTDAANGKVIVFDSDGNEVSRWGEDDKENPGWLSNPASIAIGPDGSVAVNDAMLGQVKIFTPDGEFKTAMSERKPTIEGVSMLTGLEVLSDGQVLVTDMGPRLIKQYDPNGDPRQYQADFANEDGTGRCDVHSPGAIVNDGKDRLFVAEGLANRVTALRLGEIIQEEGE